MMVALIGLVLAAARSKEQENFRKGSKRKYLPKMNEDKQRFYHRLHVPERVSLFIFG